ncbi:MAG: rhodanese-like domain-containing protein [bacterium]
MMADRNSTAAAVSPRQLKKMFHDGGELALLDVREQGIFARGHLLFAVCLPLSHLELRVAELVPRRATRIVLCDDGEGLVERAAERLAGFGYSNLARLAGGVAGWREAGFELFSGINVPSKAFGEFVEHHYATPSVSAEQLKGMLERGENLVVLDSRPLEEFRVMNIPGAVDVPGAELVYRAAELAPSADTLVVVNCAGRTRSIIGAQSLINAGLPNPVVALRNGTMGWHLAGYPLEHGSERRAPKVSAAGLARAREAAGRVAARFGVRKIDHATLARWQAQSAETTVYLLDVRNPEEFQAGHLPRSRHAPGGQLVQATDHYIATRGARVVLVDDCGVRATITASWLIQLGWEEVFVLRDALAGVELTGGNAPPAVLGLEAGEAGKTGVEEIEARQLSAALGEPGWLVVDLATSRRHADGHIPGAWWAVRSRLEHNLAKTPPCRTLVLTSSDGLLARLAVADARAVLGPSGPAIKVLAGGTEAWQAAGLPLAEGLERAAEEVIDLFQRPYDRFGGERDQEAAMREYLNWELDLVEQIARDGDARFRKFPAP